MEVVQFVPHLGKALWNLKGMYERHVENGNEIKALQSFIQDYDQQIPILQERFQEGGGNIMGTAAFQNLEKDVMEATNKLESWSTNKSFFRVFNSAERMQKLEKLHSKVMASVQKSLGIANISMLFDLQANQATTNAELKSLLESNVELKSLLITTIGNMHGTLPSKVRDEVVEASTSSFADPKFWEDILAAVANHNGENSLLEEKDMYEDPITTNLMIDPIVASNGNTYCRWTIIDNNLTTNPFNVDEDLTIVIDNLAFRRGLFEKFPEQYQVFQQRRKQYRSHALSLKAKGLWGDATLALHYVLQWNKRDVKCVEALEQVQVALQEAKEKYLQTSMVLSNEMKSKTSVSFRARNLGLAQLQAPELLELTMQTEDENVSSTDPYSKPYSYSDSSDEMIDTVVNYENNLTEPSEPSSSPVDSFELKLVREHSAASGQSGEGLEGSSLRKIHQTMDVPIRHEEHSMKDIPGVSIYVRKLMSSMSTEKKEEEDISAPPKVYRGKLKHELPKLNVLHRFSSLDIKRMTNNFSKENIIHQRYYTVYKGRQAGTGATVAVMRLRKDFVEAFEMEVEMVSRLHHKYVVALVGYCLKPDPILIYENPDNGSLYDHLHDTSAKGSTLNWRMRLHIALNAAQGLEYMHTQCRPGIIHGNVKSRNILLTPEFHGKVTDFKLAKFMSETEDGIETTHVAGDTEDEIVVGATGYLDPEYCSTGCVSTKSDVYNFGIVLLELITGRWPTDYSTPTEIYIADWVRKRLKDNNIDSILAPRVKASNPSMEAVRKVVDIAMMCVEPKSVHRPTMAQVIQELQGASDLSLDYAFSRLKLGDSRY